MRAAIDEFYENIRAIREEGDEEADEENKDKKVKFSNEDDEEISYDESEFGQL